MRRAARAMIDDLDVPGPDIAITASCFGANMMASSNCFGEIVDISFSPFVSLFSVSVTHRRAKRVSAFYLDLDPDLDPDLDHDLDPDLDHDPDHDLDPDPDLDHDL